MSAEYRITQAPVDNRAVLAISIDQLLFDYSFEYHLLRQFRTRVTIKIIRNS